MALGTTGQTPLGSQLTFKGTALGGIGFGSGGSGDQSFPGFRDYHFGAQGVLQLEAALIYTDRVQLRVQGQEVYTGAKLTPEKSSFEDITFSISDLKVRIWESHCLGVVYQVGRRHSVHESDLGPVDVKQKVQVWQLAYSVATDRFLGAGAPLSAQ